MTIVETTGGALQGRVKDAILEFRGIPYAAPPIGELRFRPPQPPEPWTGVRDATHFGPMAPQNQGAMEAMFGAPPQAMDEDCLTLNVWTPACDDGQRPVMVWIHGGAFLFGTGATPWYDGRSFARDDVVLVTINYRLGAFGFLHVDGQGNNGILDQVAALEWVRDNIAAFGGDPGNVTAFGESAGAMSVGTLLGLPAAKGLFVKAIPESGAAHSARTAEEAEELARIFLVELGIDPGPTAVDHLRDLPAAALLEAQAKVVETQMGAGGRGLPFSPVVDGVVLPEAPIDAIGKGQAAGVTVLVGTTRDEWRLFSMMDPSIAKLDDEGAARRLAGLVRDKSRAPEVVAHYRLTRPDASVSDVWSAIGTDVIFRIPAVRLAETQSALGNDVYMYRFDYATPVFGGVLGACHALEIPFVFESLDAGAEMFVGPLNDDLRTLARRMHASWVAFARTGEPAADGLPEWPRYSAEHRATMLFDLQPSVVDDPAGSDREVWAGVL
ncbi:MAG TPA: carboxylesterase/lipase family protein [Acidimicrobiales bacterium]|jgi:para-nitrobenzyl esterase|nr:carboxylesterase/lipase family protein [Acidimicrobiales bacterium]